MTPMLRTVSLTLVALSVMLMAIGAPGVTWRELQFITTLALATIVTRSMSTRYGISALSLGMGVTTLFVIGAGHAMTAAGIDTIEGIGNWGVVPLVEETVKLAPVGIVVWLYARRRRFAPNPSDLLMLGCFAGAGFALVENFQLFQQGGGIARDMARQYGPHLGSIYVVPGAWGSAGYVGHAAATGLICGGYGLGLALRDRANGYWWAIPAACAAWVLVEHMFVNLYVNSGSSFALILGNGRLTPWLFTLTSAAIIMLDVSRHRATMARSAVLARRVAMTRAAMMRMLPGARPPAPKSRPAAVMMFLSQLRAVNLTAWYIRDKTPVAVRMETV